jgi:hypothetical protein
MATRDEAKRRRSDARTRRRAEADGRRGDEPPDEETVSEPEPSTEAADRIKQAAMAAAVAATLGAAVAGARALLDRRNDGSSGAEPPTAQTEPEARGEQEADDAEPPERSHAEQEPEREEPDQNEWSEPRAEQAAGVGPDEALHVVEQARRHLRALHGEDAESVSSLERQNGGWRVGLEVLEVRRIPESTDVLATYEVILDEDANLVALTRGRRYHRSQAGGEELT